MTARSGPLGAHRRVLALFLTGVLGLALVTGTHSVEVHKRSSHSVAVLATSGADTIQATTRSDHHGAVLSAALAQVAVPRATGTPDPSSIVSSPTARAPQVRGPPGQAPA